MHDLQRDVVGVEDGLEAQGRTDGQVRELEPACQIGRGRSVGQNLEAVPIIGCEVGGKAYIDPVASNEIGGIDDFKNVERCETSNFDVHQAGATALQVPLDGQGLVVVDA